MSRWGTDHEPAGFWTILFAVCGGVLLADLVKLLFAALAAGALLSSIRTQAPVQATTPGHLPARRGLVEVQPGSDARPHLPGPVGARAAAASWACISGYIAERNGAGWTQRTPLEPCVADSE